MNYGTTECANFTSWKLSVNFAWACKESAVAHTSAWQFAHASPFRRIFSVFNTYITAQLHNSRNTKRRELSWFPAKIQSTFRAAKWCTKFLRCAPARRTFRIKHLIARKRTLRHVPAQLHKKLILTQHNLESVFQSNSLRNAARCIDHARRFSWNASEPLLEWMRASARVACVPWWVFSMISGPK